MVAPQD